VKHGGRNTPEYRSWHSMRDRCLCKTNRAYPDYGGRGITVCARWNDFAKFIADMGQRPSLEHSIDRIDNDRGYEPGNCRWATRSQQQRNRRKRPRFTLNGETLTQVEWAERYGIPTRTLGARLHNGMSLHQALTTPLPADPSRAQAKITQTDAEAIRGLVRAGKLTQREIGARFGVSQSAVSFIARGTTWRASA
jgi:hypothetical protein